jgi:hypothetical protein
VVLKLQLQKRSTPPLARLRGALSLLLLKRGAEPMAAAIFFSHSSRDRAWCELLAEAALKVGVKTYLAEHDPRPAPCQPTRSSATSRRATPSS